MNDQKQKPVRKSAEEKMAALLERQRQLDEQIKRQKKLVVEREKKLADARKLEIGELAARSGILDVPDSVIEKCFAQIAAEKARNDA